MPELSERTHGIVLDEEGVRRTLTRLAHEVVERNGGLRDLVLVGIQTRGVTLAERIAGIIESFEGERPPVGALDITLHRDDLAARGLDARTRPTALPN
nr:bifunctional pyr operon transcriptional regulator/uracil phosphoribosyltransferase [Dehalococcoidia bacterium]